MTGLGRASSILVLGTAPAVISDEKGLDRNSSIIAGYFEVVDTKRITFGPTSMKFGSGGTDGFVVVYGSLEVVNAIVIGGPGEDAVTGLAADGLEEYTCARIVVLNTLGNQMYDQVPLTGNRIDVSELSQGLYILQITTDEGTFSRKILIR